MASQVRLTTQMRCRQRTECPVFLSPEPKTTDRSAAMQRLLDAKRNNQGATHEWSRAEVVGVWRSSGASHCGDPTPVTELMLTVLLSHCPDWPSRQV